MYVMLYGASEFIFPALAPTFTGANFVFILLHLAFSHVFPLWPQNEHVNGVVLDRLAPL